MTPKMKPLLDLKELSFRDNPPSQLSALKTAKLLVQWDQSRLTEKLDPRIDRAQNFEFPAKDQRVEINLQLVGIEYIDPIKCHSVFNFLMSNG